MTRTQLNTQIKRLYHRWLQTDDIRYWMAHQRLCRERRTANLIRFINSEHAES